LFAKRYVPLPLLSLNSDETICCVILSAESNEQPFDHRSFSHRA